MLETELVGFEEGSLNHDFVVTYVEDVTLFEFFLVTQERQQK